MDTQIALILKWVLVAVGALILILLIRGWIIIYNKFQYWYNKALRKFADIDVLMQQRIDMLPALAQAIKKYDIHEYKVLKDVIEARSKWSKDTPLNEKVKSAQEIENNFFKLQAVFERYPDLKASKLHKQIMGHGNISRVESQLKHARLSYNQVVQGYNQRVSVFPRNIVAKVHGFNKLDYLQLGNKANQGPQEPYEPKGLFKD